MLRTATQNICARKSILQQKMEVSELCGALERLEGEWLQSRRGSAGRNVLIILVKKWQEPMTGSCNQTNSD